MTDDELRGLDVLLARGFGWKCQQDADGEWWVEREGHWTVVGGVVCPVQDPLPRLSSTGDGMLLVMEEMGKHGWAVDLRKHLVLNEYSAEFSSPANAKHCWWADTGPLAVALAAKAALEAERD